MSDGRELDDRDMFVNVDVVVRMQVSFRLGEWPDGNLPAWKRNPHTIKQEMLRRLDSFRRHLLENGITMAFVPEKVSTTPARLMQEGGVGGEVAPVSSSSLVAEVEE